MQIVNTWAALHQNFWVYRQRGRAKNILQGLTLLLKKLQFFHPFRKKIARARTTLCKFGIFFLGKTPLFVPETWSGAPPRNNVVCPVSLETFFFENFWGTAPGNHGGSTPRRRGYTAFHARTCLHWCGVALGTFFFDNCWGTAPGNHEGCTPCGRRNTLFHAGKCLHWCEGAHGLVPACVYVTGLCMHHCLGPVRC